MFMLWTESWYTHQGIIIKRNKLKNNDNFPTLIELIDQLLKFYITNQNILSLKWWNHNKIYH